MIQKIHSKVNKYKREIAVFTLFGCGFGIHAEIIHYANTEVIRIPTVQNCATERTIPFNREITNITYCGSDSALVESSTLVSDRGSSYKWKNILKENLWSIVS